MIKQTGISPTLSIILATGLLMSIIGFHTNLNSFGTFPDQPTAQLGKGSLYRMAYSPDDAVEVRRQYE